MEKPAILDAIKRTCHENGGSPLGQRRFTEETGIPVSAWRGKYWARWGDAVEEAGFSRNTPNEAHDPDLLVRCLAELTRELGHFPTYADLRLARRRDSRFPTHHAFSKHLGQIEDRLHRVRLLATANAEFSDVLSLLPNSAELIHDGTPARENEDGFVYMLKFGKHYKIGYTTAVPRRHREISLELPEKPDLVHKIATDDPPGIEAYWHQRFAAKRTQGEWFALSREDVLAFKRRGRFM